MGDRTEARFSVATNDLDQVREILGERNHEVANAVDSPEGISTFTIPDANYGGEFEVEALHAAGIPVVVEYASGGSFPPGVIVSDGVEITDRELHDGHIVVRFIEHLDGVAPESLAEARRFCAVRKRALELMASR
jgi:hypothetical protein